jgi:hypothetical protein
MQETGGSQGYMISRTGFQSGAFEASRATNIQLVTYEEFQERFFTKWFNNRIWAIENAIGNINVYYEPGPCGRCGYHLLKDDQERAAYDAVWNKCYFAGMMLSSFSPYLHLSGSYPIPPLPFDVHKLEENGFLVPEDIKATIGYRELLAALERYARIGLDELRAVNPATKSAAAEEFVEELNAPMPRISPE